MTITFAETVWGGVGGGFLAWVTVPCRALTDIFWRKCVPPDLECGWQGVLNSMDIHQSVLGCILTPRTAVKYDFPEDFLEISHSSKMWTATKACLTSVTKNAIPSCPEQCACPQVWWRVLQDSTVTCKAFL